MSKSMTCCFKIVSLLLLCIFQWVKPNAVFAAGDELASFNKDVQGVVIDSSGQTQPDVNVIVKGGAAGTTTDKKGRYQLKNVPENAVLVFSAVGFTTIEVSVAGKTIVNVTLQQGVGALEDVIVVGYGRQKKITKTAAISQISGDEVRKAPSASLQNTLSGKVPGFFSVQRSGQPGADGADFYIRGISTFSENSQQPYILVDDIEYSYAQFSRIDPNEVETITILKDAGSTAIYGIKGANGVILVTTRRGKIGKPKINFKSQTGLQVPVKPMTFLNSYETAILRNEALVNEGRTPQFTQVDLDLFKDGTDPYRHPDINWYDVLIKKSSVMTNNNIDLSGGGERMKYFVSAGYLYQNGNLKDFKTPSIYKDDNVNNNYYYNRYNFRSNLDITATKSLNFKLDLSGNYEERNSPATAGSGIFYELAHYEQLPPFAYNQYNPDGTYGFSDGLLIPKPAEGNANNIIGRIAMGGYNRIFGNQLNINLSGVQKLDALTQGLSARVTAAFSNVNYSSRSVTRGNNFPSFSYNGLINAYTPRDPNLYRVAPLSLGYSGGNPVRTLTLQGALAYNRAFGRHNIGSLLLYNQNTEAAPAAYIPSKLRGYTYRLTYNYREKYLFEANGAYNGTDRFVSQKRYGFFPALSAGYNIAAENFFIEALPFIDLFKLRGSWGIVGDDAISAGSRYLYEEVYNRYSGAAYFGESPNSLAGVSEGTLGNKDVTWQKERKSNLGLDFSILKGMFSGVIDVFDNNRYDILRNRQTVPFYFGVTTVPPVNIGRVSNKGFEIELSHRGNIGKVTYNLRGTFSYAKNKILEIDEPPAKYPWLQQTGTSIGTYRMYMWDGFYQDQADVDSSAKPTGIVRPGYLKYRDLNGDHLINDDDRGFSGSPNVPSTNYGLNLAITYKSFSISALLQGAAGYNFNVGWRLATPFKANLQPLHQKRWTAGKGNNVEFPLLVSDFNATYMSPTDNQLSTFWSMKAHYIRFRSVEVSYDLPTKWISRFGMEDVRVFVSGFNLYTWSNVFNKYQYDPETIGNLTDNAYPQQRIFNAGINFSLK